MPPPYLPAAISFGNNLANTFQVLNGPATHTPAEIKKFDNLIESFKVIGTAGFDVRNYHGSYSQVEFPHAPPWTRHTPRCELADVLFVAYDSTQMRISFLQAKSKVAANPYPVWLANAEQFVVLAQRPVIANWLGTVVWNNDVLSNAILPSVGSFGIFCGIPGLPVEFHYVAADLLYPITGPSVKKFVSGSFDSRHSALPVCRSFGHIIERTYCLDMADFGAALFSLEIGSPIQGAGVAGNNLTALNARAALANWAKRELAENPDDSTLRNLLNSPNLQDLPDIEMNDERSIGAKQVVVIQASNRRD